MNNKNNSKSYKKNASDPSSPNYDKQIKNKENQKSPSGEDEPSTRTTFK